MTTFYRIELESEGADYGTEDTVASRYLYTNRLLAKAGAAEFVGEVHGEEFDNIQARRPVADDFDWTEDDHGATGTLEGWTFEVHVLAMELKDE